MKKRWILVTVIAVLALGIVGLWYLSKSRTFQLYGGLVSRVDTDDRIVALTFDDGPTPEGVDEILPVLIASGVRATFFVTGGELERNPDAGRRLVEAGHELGNHSYSHATMIFRSPSFIADEIERTDVLIRETGYTGPITFRPPYGKRLFLLPRYLHQTGRTTLLWDVEPESYPDVVVSAESIAEHVLENTRPGSIILLHVMYRSRAESRRAVPLIIDGLRDRGYRFVTVSELVGA